LPSSKSISKVHHTGTGWVFFKYYAKIIDQGLAEVLDATDIFMGVNSVDFSGYPDCRPEFIESFQRTANLATKTGAEGKGVNIHAPLINMTKGEIIKKGVSLGVDYAMTHSCYNPGKDGLPCGQCDSCLLRKTGFEEAGIADPLLIPDLI